MKTLGWKALLVAASLTLPAAGAQAQVGSIRASAGAQPQQSDSRIPPPKAAPAATASTSAAPTKEQIAKGRADAPALVQAAGTRCAIADAAFRGSGSSSGKKVDIYETACTDGPGYLLIRTQGVEKPAAYPCLAVADQGTKCVLPANADQKPGLAKLAQAAGRPCAISDARYLGSSTTTGESFYELACSGAGGLRLGVPAAAAATPDATDCLAMAGTAQPCTLTSKAQTLAELAPLVQASGRACQVSDARFLGASDTTKQTYYEVACGASPGFVIATDTASRAFKSVIGCGQARGLAGGCTLTSATASAAEDNARYVKLAAAAGFPCQVNRTRPIGSDSQGREVIELACADRPDGAFALFPTTPGAGKTEIVDCVKATGTLQRTCELTQPSALYTRYSAALSAKGRGSCKVSNALYIGRSGSGNDVIETACTDGKPGWVIIFANASDTAVSQLLNCTQSASDGRPCKLPTNLAGNGPTKRS